MNGQQNADVEVAVGLLLASGLSLVVLAAIIVVELVQQWRRSR